MPYPQHLLHAAAYTPDPMLSADTQHHELMPHDHALHSWACRAPCRVNFPTVASQVLVSYILIVAAVRQARGSLML